MTLSQALIAEAVPPRQRGKYQGYLSGMYATAAMFGPVAGGWLTLHFGWPSVFLVNLPLGLLAMSLVRRLPMQPVRGGRLQFDVWGTLLFAGFIAPILLALERAQKFDPGGVAGRSRCWWASRVVALVLLLRQERRAPAPLLPVQMFRKPGIWRTDLMAACVAAQTVSLVTFLPMYLQVVRGQDAAQSGLLLLPLTLGVSIGSLFAGRTIARTGHTAIMPVDRPGGHRLRPGRAGTVRRRMSNAQLILLLVLIAGATGPTMPVVQMTVQVVAGPQFLGAAAASVQFSRSVGAAFGTALVGAVLFAPARHARSGTAQSFSALVEQGPHVLGRLAAGAPAAGAAAKSPMRSAAPSWRSPRSAPAAC